MSRTISKTQFKKEILESGSSHLSLVQFKTEWSGACQIIAPVYEELSKCYNGIADFFSIDVEQEADMEKEFGVLELPTILFFKNGELIDHVIGLTPKKALISKIENALKHLKNTLL
ncbi:MAG TPA: thioredoxin domain-containing protein [Puia sp.]